MTLHLGTDLFSNISSIKKSTTKALWSPIPKYNSMILAALGCILGDTYTISTWLLPLKKVVGGGLFEKRDDISINLTSDRALCSFPEHIFSLVLILYNTITTLQRISYQLN